MKKFAEGPLDWQHKALCGSEDPNLFFGEDGERKAERLKREKLAKRACAECEVRVTCLNYALDNGEVYGMWGGLGEDERAKLLARRTIRLSQNRSA